MAHPAASGGVPPARMEELAVPDALPRSQSIRAVDGTRSARVRNLARQLRRVENARRLPIARRTLPTGLDLLDQLLPGGGLRPGTIVEWLSDGNGAGAATLALHAAARMLKERESLFVIDPERDFHPVAAASLGIDLQRIVVIQPPQQDHPHLAGPVDAHRSRRHARAATTNDTLWALEQTLRSPAVAITICRTGYLNGHVFRRLQLAAETGGGLGFLLRPIAAMRQPTWADVRLLVEPRWMSDEVCNADSASRSLTVTLLRCRRSLTGASVKLHLI